MTTREMLTEKLSTDASLSTYMAVFKSLPPLAQNEFHGAFEGIIVGTPFFQGVFNTLMTLGGLKGWQGKEFGADGNGINVLLQDGKIRKVAPMFILGTIPSLIDGQPTLTLNYRRAPHVFIQDELRRLDHRTLLGMTYLKIGVLNRIPMPFVLRWK